MIWVWVLGFRFRFGVVAVGPWVLNFRTYCNNSDSGFRSRVLSTPTLWAVDCR